MRLSTLQRRRALAIGITGCLALGSALGLVGVLASCGAGGREPSDPSRPLSSAEAGRLASMRLNNYTDARAGLRGTLGRGTDEVALAGWVDWRRQLVYLSVAGRTPGASDALVQAVPGTVALRQDPLAAATASPAPAASASPGTGLTAPVPPLPPPADGWRVRPFEVTGPTVRALDAALLLLFMAAASRPDAADLLANSDARWLRADRVDGIPVDVLLGPAVPPGPGSPNPTPSPSGGAAPGPGPTSLAAQGGEVRYWLDGDGRLRRLETVVGENAPLRLDVRRGDHREIVATDLLGGRPVAPRRVTGQEAAVLARLSQHGRMTGGGPVSIEVPAPDLDLLTANGWLDWGSQVVYLAVRDTAGSAERSVLRADPTGVSSLTGAARTADGRPPVPVPRGAWQRTGWAQRADQYGATDLDLLLTGWLAAAGGARKDTEELTRTAAWLRTDVIAGVPVVVYEILGPAEQGQSMGSGRLRYWVDTSGVLRRLEVRARSGGYGRMDLTPGTVPYIGAARTA